MVLQFLFVFYLFLCATATKQEEDTANIVMLKLLHTVEDMRDDMAVTHGELGQLKITVGKQQETISSLQNEMNDTNVKLLTLLQREAYASPEQMYMYTTFGCYSDLLTLSCPDDRLINVTDADYGMYAYPCSSECCPPHPVYDCREAVSENTPQDWVAIKLLCDTRTNCTFENTGAPLDDCQEGYPADYMQVYYKCMPEEAEGYVGFTVTANENQQFTGGEVVLFQIERTNLGGHFELSTSTFQCPYSGTYLFCVNFVAYSGARMNAYILHAIDTTRLVRAEADDIPTDNTNSHGSAFTITECAPGQVVWVEANGSGYLKSGYASHFSGYMLNRY